MGDRQVRALEPAEYAGSEPDGGYCASGDELYLPGDLLGATPRALPLPGSAG